MMHELISITILLVLVTEYYWKFKACYEMKKMINSYFISSYLMFKKEA